MKRAEALRRPPPSSNSSVILLDNIVKVLDAPQLTISRQDFLLYRGGESLGVGGVLVRVVFYESGESRKNFSYAGSKEYFFGRQPPFYPSTRHPGSRPLVSRVPVSSESSPRWHSACSVQAFAVALDVLTSVLSETEGSRPPPTAFSGHTGRHNVATETRERCPQSLHNPQILSPEPSTSRCDA